MAAKVSPRMALVTVLAFFACHLRPGVAAALVIEQFMPPLRHVGQDGKRGPEQVWCMNLHPQEWEIGSKTGMWDETVEITDVDEWSWLDQCLAARMAESSSRAFGHEAAQAQRP